MSGSLRFAVILVGNERHRRDLRLEKLAALFELEERAGRGLGRRHIAHRDRPPERRRMSATGDASDLVSFAVEDQRPLAHRLLAIDQQANALEQRALIDLADNPRRAGKSALGAAALAD